MRRAELGRAQPANKLISDVTNGGNFYVKKWEFGRSETDST
jgi:hypothetical protein